MNILNTDELFSIAINLDLLDLLNFCNSSKRINELVCKKDAIWLYKINKDFPNSLENSLKNPKLCYQRLYWKNLKNKLKYEGTVEKLLNVKELYLSYFQLTEIPKEIGNLYNLQKLNFSGNQLTEIPKEIGNLHKLQELNLFDNKLTEIPKEIGNLHNLQILWLDNNQLKEIPKEIGNLHNLQTLYFHNNQLKDIPKEIGNLQDLRIYKNW